MSMTIATVCRWKRLDGIDAVIVGGGCAGVSFPRCLTFNCDLSRRESIDKEARTALPSNIHQVASHLSPCDHPNPLRIPMLYR